MILRVLGVAIALLVPPVAQASPPLDLVEESGLRMELSRAESPTGFGPDMGLTAVGDFNGDGLEDLAVGQPGPARGGREERGVVYIALGQPDLRAAPGVIGLDSVIRILPEPGRAIRLADRLGDMNGDGFDDVAVTSYAVGEFDELSQPRAAVVFGSATPIDVDLSNLGSAGFQVDGEEAHGGTGDLDGDGFDELAVDNSTRRPRVLFGAPGGHDGALTIRLGEGDDPQLGSVAAAGDVNGDGRGDVLVGVRFTVDPEGFYSGGSVTVVFGDDLRGQTVDLGNLGSRGFRVHGIKDTIDSTRQAAGVGDVNGDGYDDVAYDSSATHYTTNPPIETIVILGAPASEDLEAASLGARGYRLEANRPWTDLDIAPAGDLNADGRADVLIGSGGVENRGVLNAPGAAYLVFGGSTTDFDLRSLGGPGDDPRGYVMRGVPGDRAGDAVAVPGDMDGDGQAELAVLGYRCTGVPSADFLQDITYVPQVYLPDADAHAQNRGRSTHGADTLDVTPGDALLRGRGGRDVLTGDDAANCLFGDYGHDVIVGRGAGDVLLGAPGRDTLTGGDGGDLLQGGASPDQLEGGPGDDALAAGGGDDDLDGGAGDDHMHGGAGKDRLRGDEGDDRLYGERGADVLRSGGPSQWLSGGGGPDVIHDSGGRTDVFGGRGDDEIDVADGEKDTVYCHVGRDKVRADRVDEISAGSGRHADGGCENVVRVDPGA